MPAGPTTSAFIRGSFVAAPSGVLAYPFRDSQLRDSAGFSPDFASHTAPGAGPGCPRLAPDARTRTGVSGDDHPTSRGAVPKRVGRVARPRVESHA